MIPDVPRTLFLHVALNGVNNSLWRSHVNTRISKPYTETGSRDFSSREICSRCFVFVAVIFLPTTIIRKTGMAKTRQKSSSHALLVLCTRFENKTQRVQCECTVTYKISR